MLKVKVLSSYKGAAYEATLQTVKEAGCKIVNSGEVDIIIAPDYDELITDSELRLSRHGALVFHPSPLPRMKGRNAIKRQYKAGDVVGGGTWFWAGKMIDGGDICDQEVCEIDLTVRPREYYEKLIIPIMERGLIRALDGITRGHARRVPQITAN